MSPTKPMNVAAVIMSTPGTVMSRPISAEPNARSGDRALHDQDLGAERGDLAQAALDRDALIDRQLDLAQPGPPGLAEQVADAGNRRSRCEPARHGSRSWLGCADAPAARAARSSAATP